MQQLRREKETALVYFFSCLCLLCCFTVYSLDMTDTLLGGVRVQYDSYDLMAGNGASSAGIACRIPSQRPCRKYSRSPPFQPTQRPSESGRGQLSPELSIEQGQLSAITSVLSTVMSASTSIKQTLITAVLCIALYRYQPRSPR